MTTPAQIMLLRDTALPVLLFGTLVSSTLFWPTPWMAGAFLIMSVGHFLMPTYYHAKAGKVTARYLALAGGVAATAIAIYALFPSSTLLMKFGIAVAASHFAIDEFYLHGEKITFHKVLTLLLYCSVFMILSFAPQEEGAMLAFGLLGAGTAVLFSVRAFLQNDPPSRAEWYLAGVALLAVAMVPTSAQLLHFTSLLHFSNWYIAIGLKLAPQKERARNYWIWVAVLTALGAVLYGVYLAYPESVLKYYFFPFYYVGWFLVHMTISSRFASGAKRPITLPAAA